MKKIAVTGISGSGKSTVAQFLKKWGAEVIDADEIAHKVLEDKKEELIKVFGEEIVRGDRIDRKKLGKRVFLNEKDMEKLFSIVKKDIVKKIDYEISKTKTEICVVDAPLLFEYGLENKFDKIIVVKAKEEERLKRFISKTGYSKELAKKIFENQMKEEEKVKKSDYVITNNGSLEELEIETRKIWERIKRDP